MPEEEVALGRQSFAPAWSTSIALVIAASGVRSSCAAFATNSRSACSRRSRSEMSIRTKIAADSGPPGKPLQPQRAIVVGANDQVQLLRAGIVQARGELPERRLRPGVDELHPGLRSEQLFRCGVREHDLQVLVNREDAFVQSGEQAREAVLVEPAGECGRGGPCHGGIHILCAQGRTFGPGYERTPVGGSTPSRNRGAADRWQRSRA